MPNSDDKNQVVNFDGFSISMEIEKFIYSQDYTSLFSDKTLFLDFDNFLLWEEEMMNTIYREATADQDVKNDKNVA